MIDNDALDVEDVDPLKDDLEYYLEANQEPDFMETMDEDDIYEELGGYNLYSQPRMLG